MKDGLHHCINSVAPAGRWPAASESAFQFGQNIQNDLSTDLHRVAQIKRKEQSMLIRNLRTSADRSVNCYYLADPRLLFFEQATDSFRLALLRAAVELFLIGNDVAQQRDHFIIRFQLQHAIEHLLHVHQDFIGERER